MEQKKCSKCGAVRDYAIKSGKRAGKLHTYCRKCLSAQVADWSSRNREHVRKQQREWWQKNPVNHVRAHMRRYGVDETWYFAKLEEQNGVCAICHKPEDKLGTRLDGNTRRLSADHCHKSLKLRGLLCNTCNMRLAGLEAHDWLASATAYLAKYQP